MSTLLMILPVVIGLVKAAIALYEFIEAHPEIPEDIRGHFSRSRALLDEVATISGAAAERAKEVQAA